MPRSWSAADVATTGPGTPAPASQPSFSAWIRRHSGTTSTLLMTATTSGHTFRAAARKSSSGRVYSWEASETKTTASAMASVVMVAEA